MKNFFEGIKDFLYDSVDYIIMVGIVGIVVLVIGWRLDLLFAKDALDMPPKTDIIVEDNKDNDSSTIDNSQEQTTKKPADESKNNNLNNKDDISETQETETTPENSNNNNTNESIVDKVIKITIPSGSLPSKIGSILESNGLASKIEFVQKAQELKLDTKLKSGDYEIKAGSSVEEIVKLIAGKK
ncbi:hypothetical protein [Tissierella praeacuta]|uniref:hypothetical protein n=1 Tax=Tissierella praeacuta TaxID=43131 RepID=UPI0028AFC896|nr:hypothetical protein [Tissierella praeacuta]